MGKLDGIFIFREFEEILKKKSRGVPLSWLIIECDKGLIVYLT